MQDEDVRQLNWSELVQHKARFMWIIKLMSTIC